MKIKTMAVICYDRLIPIYGVDRVTIWTDRTVTAPEVDELCAHCASLNVITGQPKFQANRKCKLELFQPTRKCLRLLRRILGVDINADLTYVELACDLPLPKIAREAFRAAFLQAVKVPHQRSLFTQCRGTYYCGQRARIGDRDGSVLVLYTDRPSKLNNARPAADAMSCFHVELRLSGKDALAKYGIRSLDDLVCFDHELHWQSSLKFYVMPCKTELGRRLAACRGGRADASNPAYLKRANRWLDSHHVDGLFVMHNALKSLPKLTPYLIKTGWSGLQERFKKQAHCY